jgi:hypothetical protein
VLKRKMADDEKYEKQRLQKRQKRQQGSTATPTTDAVETALPGNILKMTKKEATMLKRQGQTDDVLLNKANETASMALGFSKKKNKYSWMDLGNKKGGVGGGSGAATPRATAAAGGSGKATPAAPTPEKALQGRKRTFGTDIENTEIGERIQIRDLVHVLEHDGREKKTLSLMLARLKNTEKDEKKPEFDRRPPAAIGR